MRVNWNITFSTDSKIVVVQQTADQMYANFKTVSCSMENQMITPCTIFFHACQLVS